MRLRVLSFNIHRAIGVDRRFRPRRIVRVLEHYDPDIALLQEVDEGVPRSRELDLGREIAEQAGYPHLAIGHNVSLRKGKYGNATLSRFPIVRERNIDLTIRRKKRRGCQHTRIEIAGCPWPFEAFNLHLGLSAAERQQQAEILARSRELRRVGEATPCVVGGDFNDWRSLLHPIFTGRLGFASATDPHGRGTVRTYPSFSPQGCLDRVYYRGPLELIQARSCRLGVSKVASDHLPVIADFELADGE